VSGDEAGDVDVLSERVNTLARSHSEEIGRKADKDRVERLEEKVQNLEKQIDILKEEILDDA